MEPQVLSPPAQKDSVLESALIQDTSFGEGDSLLIDSTERPVASQQAKKRSVIRVEDSGWAKTA